MHRGLCLRDVRNQGLEDVRHAFVEIQYSFMIAVPYRIVLTDKITQEDFPCSSLDQRWRERPRLTAMRFTWSSSTSPAQYGGQRSTPWWDLK